MSAFRRPYVPRDPDATARNMAAIRSTENKTEVALRKALWRRGFRYRKYDRRFPGRPDMVFVSRKVAVFVDGDYWHGRLLIEHGPEAMAAYLKTERQKWWMDKISQTVERDARAAEELRGSGWTVIRLWESDVRKDIEGTADTIAKLLAAVSPTSERLTNAR